MTVQLYGIPNCDTVRRARAWLVEAGVVHVFNDYKKQGVDTDRLARWADAVGWEQLLNRAGTTFRRLDEAQRTGIDHAKALALMAAHPSLIRRPVVEHDGGLLAGFDPDTWREALA